MHPHFARLRQKLGTLYERYLRRPYGSGMSTFYHFEHWPAAAARGS